MNNEEWYAKRFQIGLAAEKMYERYLLRQWSCRKPTPQDPKEPYDYECIHDIWFHRKTVEIKNYGSPKLRTIFAETLQVKSNTVPEYLLYPHLIDEMVYVDQVGRRAFIYDMKKFAAYVEATKYREIEIDAGTARGIIFSEDMKAAGYIKTINI
jgi:hypothetical protein